jgi:hypothetical protein
LLLLAVVHGVFIIGITFVLPFHAACESGGGAVVGDQPSQVLLEGWSFNRRDGNWRIPVLLVKGQ